MKICLFDDSVPFDAWTPARKPLGGAEKAFALLPGPLAGRGHEVHVYNRCQYSMPIEAARWHNPDAPRPAEADALIAFRRPSLLESARRAGRRLLWVTAAPEYLTKKPAREYLEALRPTLVFIGQAQKARAKGEGVVVRPGAAAVEDRHLGIRFRPPRHDGIHRQALPSAPLPHLFQSAVPAYLLTFLMHF